MTTPLNIITDALLSIGAVAGGETPTPGEANDAFRFLNNLLDQLSNESMMLFCKQEVIHELTPNQYIYTIGPGGQVTCNFTGTITGSQLSVSAIQSGALSVGQTIFGNSAGTGSVAGYTVNNGAAGFTGLAPIVSVSGDGAGATGTAYLSMFPELQIAPLLGGTGYKAGQLLTAVGGAFVVPATFRIASVSGGVITQVIVENQGQYTDVTAVNGNVNPSGGTGTGCVLALGGLWCLGSIVSGNAGFGYTFATVTITPATGGASAAAIIGGNVLSGTTITSYGTAQGGNSTPALGTYFLNTVQTLPAMALTSYAPRPLKINSAFVRVPSSAGNLDYVVDPINIEQYEQIGLKQLSGPWPRAVYYQPSQPLGILNYWPNPSQGEMHLICDMLLLQFATLQDVVVLPQGYAMALMWMLAEILMPQYPATAAAQETRAMVPGFANRGRALIKRTNMQPIQQVRFDTILNSARTQDAGWILSGGFNRNS